MKMIPKPILDFIQESLNRLFLKKPKLFTYWQWVSGVLVAVCGIPYLLTQFPNIHLPSFLEFLSSKAVTWAAGGMWFMSQLTVKAPPIAQTEDGQELKTTDPKAMPFTAKQEAKELEATVPPPPVVEGLDSNSVT